MLLHTKSVQNPYSVFYWETKENKTNKKSFTDLKMNNHTQMVIHLLRYCFLHQQWKQTFSSPKQFETVEIH